MSRLNPTNMIQNEPLYCEKTDSIILIGECIPDYESRICEDCEFCS